MYNLIFPAVSVFTLFSLIILIFFYYVPNQQHKNAVKQKAKEDIEKKEQYDLLLNEYPTISRYTTDASFRETEFVGTTGPILPMES